MKAKLALLELSPSSSQNSKTFQTKNKGLVVETFDWDEEEVSDEEEVTQVKVLMALNDDEFIVGKSHACNGEWVDITIRKVNTLLSIDEDADWQNYLIILVPKSQSVNESLKPTENTPESSKDSEVESLTPLPPLKNLQGASPSSESVSGTVTVSETQPTTPSVPTEVKNTEQEFKKNELTKLVQMLIDEKMDVKSDFLYSIIEEEVYVCQPPGFEDPQFLDKVYKVEKALYGLHQAPRAWYETLSTYLLENRFRRGTIDKTLFIKNDKDDILLVQRDDGVFISQDKYMADILKKFDFSLVKTASTPVETNKALLKDEEAEDVDVHLYRSMIGSLMYLTASRLDIMFVVCACASFQVTPKVSHLHTVKWIFRYLK
ncbi:putative ribonuclease H-like domain-containing protein, partial [Tanacetum coccineum]